jgi:hypothetical protein
MDHVSIYGSSAAESSNTLHVGVEVRYEANDADNLLHMLRFLEAYTEERGGKFTLMPVITHGDNKVTGAWLLEQFEKIPEGNRMIRGVISVHFLDEMRPVFDAYLKTLREIKECAEKEYEWDEAHPFFPIADYFEYIATQFFPDKTALN